MNLAKLTRSLAIGLLAGSLGCTTLLGDFQATSGPIGEAGSDQSAATSTADAGAGDATGGGDDSTTDATSLATSLYETSVVTFGRDGAALQACGANQQECSGACVDLNDPVHCGSCGHDCTSLSHVAVTPTCVAGACTLMPGSCVTGYAHCSTNPDDGCEVNVTQPTNCGGCGNACPATAPLCSTTARRAVSADSGLVSSAAAYACVPSCVAPASTLCGQQCVDTTSDPNNCGGCTTTCPLGANAQATCTVGQCGYVCDQAFHDCGGQCVDDASPATCGAACASCAAPASNGMATCSGAPLACGISCSQGFNLCPGNQCVDFQSDPANCSACENACPGATNGLGVGICGKAACGVQCNAGLSLCADNSCYDLQSDDHNCGSCGHECYGGAGSCVSSSCQPFVLAKVTNPFGIAADGKLVYFDDNATGSVYSIDPSSKKSVALASVVGSAPWTLTTDGDNVYWVTQAPGNIGGVYQVPVDGSQSALQIAVDVAAVWGITVDKTNVYYSTAIPQPSPPVYPLPASGPNGHLYSIPIGGGSTTLLWPPAGNPPDGGITSIMYNPNDGLIYFVNYQGTTANPLNSFVRRIKTDGTNETDIYPAGAASMGLWVSSQAVFVSNYTGSTEYMPIGTMGAGAIRDQLGSGSWGWAGDAKWAYWVDAKASAVWKYPADGTSGLAAVANNVGTDVRQIAADARGLYWTSFGDGTVWMLAH